MTLRKILGAALVALAGASIYMSWGALYEFALATGMPPERAVVFPAVIDVVTVVAMLIALYVKDLSPSARVYPWLALGLFGAATIAGNAMHVVTVPSDALRVDVWVAVAANALPAIALMLTTHLAAVTVFHEATQPEEALEAEEAPEGTGATVTLATAVLKSDARAMIPAKREDRRALVLRLRADGLTPADIHRETSIPTSTISRYLNPPTSKAQPA